MSPRRRRPPPAAARGFTLIEVLLATVLLAAGLGLAFATVRAATATVDRGEAMAQRSETMRAVEQFLRRRLAATQPLGFMLDQETGTPIRFVGEPDRVRFVADLPNYLGRGGPHLHDIAVLEDGDRLVLAASFAMVMSGETVEEAEPRAPEPLVRDLVEARFRYRGLGADGAPGEWLDSWEDPESLPMQVSIEIASEGAGAWPPLVVALPQAGGDVGPTEFGSSGRVRNRGRMENRGRGNQSGRGGLLDGGAGDRKGRR